MNLDIVDRVNSLIRKSILTNMNPNSFEYKSTYISHDDVWFSTPINTFDKIVTDLIESDTDLKNSVSNEGAYALLLDLVYEYKKNEFIITKENSLQLLEAVKSKPICEWVVFHKLFGLTISRDTPAVAGNFCFYNYHMFRKHIREFLSENNDNCVDLCLNRFSEKDNIVSTVVYARDSSKAKEIAYQRFDALQNILRFFVSYWNLTFFDIGITNYKKHEIDTCIALCGDTLHFSNESLGKIHQIDFDDFQNHFITHEFSPVGVIEKYCKEDKNQIEKKIMTAISLLGRAVYDMGKPISFLQSMMAIEALIQVNTNHLVNQSITAQIAEYSAFLLEDNCEKRIAVEKLMKKLYKIRSSLAHGSSTECSLEDCTEVLCNARDLIVVFFDNDEIKDFSEPRELQEYIQKLKYRA